MQSTSIRSATGDFWSPAFRLTVFVLAATSIWSLLTEFGGWWSTKCVVVTLSAHMVFGIVRGLASLRIGSTVEAHGDDLTGISDCSVVRVATEGGITNASFSVASWSFNSTDGM